MYWPAVLVACCTEHSDKQRLTPDRAMHVGLSRFIFLSSIHFCSHRATMPRAGAAARKQEKLQSEAKPARDRSTRIAERITEAQAQAAAKRTHQGEEQSAKRSNAECMRLRREAERDQQAHQPRDKEHYFLTDWLEMRACACCRELTFLNKSKVVVIDDAWARRMRDRLPCTEHISQGLRDDYDLSKQAGADWDFLSGVPLSESWNCVDSCWATTSAVLLALLRLPQRR